MAVERTSSVGLLTQLQLRRGLPVRSQAVRGDARALAAVYERHHQALYRYCRSILHDDEEARDALQSTMAKALAALRDERRDFELRPWLFRIAHNEAISIVRRRREIADPETVAAASTDSLAQDVEDRERLAHLQVDLQHLPERQRAALVLRELSGLSHKEIASVLDTTPRVVKQTIFEARVALRDCETGRAMRCDDVQRMLSDGDGRVPRGRRVRAHLRSCRSCRQFQAEMRSRPADMAALAPALPAAAGAALLGHLLPGAKAGFASATGAATGAGGGLAGTVGTKAAVVVATTAALAGSTAAVRTVVVPAGQANRTHAHAAPASAHAAHTRQVSVPSSGAPPVLAPRGASTRAPGVTRGHERSSGTSAKHSARAHGKAKGSAKHSAHANGRAKGHWQGLPPGQAKKVAAVAAPGNSAVAHAQLRPAKPVKTFELAKPAKPMNTAKPKTHRAHPVHPSATVAPPGAAHRVAAGKLK